MSYLRAFYIRRYVVYTRFKNLELEMAFSARGYSAAGSSAGSSAAASSLSSLFSASASGAASGFRPQLQRREPPQKLPRVRQESPQLPPRQPGVRCRPLRWVVGGIGLLEGWNGLPH